MAFFTLALTTYKFLKSKLFFKKKQSKTRALVPPIDLNKIFENKIRICGPIYNNEK